ncbi:C4-dicarboxylate transporter/malic acid transport protein [Rhodospirillaceae bacterium LM-1]|nr:C4-dicarboxylate transporter/malic acid transport protein [Rhodospirillaceae bacterium LM-1]
MTDGGLAEPNRIRDFPVSFFSTVMGLSGFTLAFRRFEKVYDPPLQISVFLFGLTFLLFALLAATYARKALTYPNAVSEEWHHPVRISFFPAISISLILLAAAAHGISDALSLGLWVIGSVAHLVLTLAVMTAWINHSRFEIAHSNPAWFIPVVGNVLVPIVGVHHAPADISWLFFTVGMLFWLVLLTIIINRLIFHSPLPGKLVPTLAILLAPPSVGFVSWVTMTNEIDAVARLLYFAAVFFFLLLLAQLPKFAKLDFTLSWWAYSFPLAAFTIATFQMGLSSGKPFYIWAADGLLAALILVIIGLVLRTIKAIGNGEICKPET